MTRIKGVTLIEVIVVLLIVGIIAVIAIPNFLVSAERTNAQSARNNLMAISAAQSKFYDVYTGYCLDVGNPPHLSNTTNCGDNVTDLNINLGLTVSSSDSFNYKCDSTATPYKCTAQDSKITLTTSGGTVTCSPAGVYCPS